MVQLLSGHQRHSHLEYEATLYKTGNVDGGLAQASIDISIGYQ
ncbi:hypothetical protein AB6E88_12185 [Providencia hangzhouensis]